MVTVDLVTMSLVTVVNGYCCHVVTVAMGGHVIHDVIIKTRCIYAWMCVMNEDPNSFDLQYAS